MSDKLASLLAQIQPPKSSKNKDPDQRVIDALKKALDATTPTHAGTPWDKKDDSNSLHNYIYCIPESKE